MKEYNLDIVFKMVAQKLTEVFFLSQVTQAY